MIHARDRIRDLTHRSRLWMSVEAVVQEVNAFLRRWATYFEYGHSTIRIGKIRHYAIHRLAIFIGKRHKRGRRFGIDVVAYRSPDQCGLIKLSGIVVPPRAGKPWREKLNTGGERRR
ncbi:hypothetical protein FHR32_008045 [Streptosporangium album]|uniref:Group II intron maturase-specific domain-containing protein n=1 Tax=Streptosporangium album TaxID=47479 RepID=A0A7W7S4B5_9ACTN|nr:group II intron maturase-specific domain-containing protein [Streptosporangium album]MBB4943645.1 hypothetical protein [Streptosporangium album]